jgi:two-component system alkaline phosphatase synthesis response regulator PhoP
MVDMAKKDLKILILDDDFEITRSVSTYLEQLGYLVKSLNSPEGFLELLQDFKPDLIVLDIILPDVNGIEICQMIRRLPTYYPIIMLTSKADVVDKVVGLEVGADDYVPKPFSLRELEARIKAVLRRQLLEKKAHDEAVQQTVIQQGDIIMDLKNRILKIGSRKVDLTPKEFELMKLFLQNPGKAYSRDELLEKVWGVSYKGYHRTIDSHINRLRLKIEANPNHPEIVSTVWGVGYKFNEDYEPKP